MREELKVLLAGELEKLDAAVVEAERKLADLKQLQKVTKKALEEVTRHDAANQREGMEA